MLHIARTKLLKRYCREDAHVSPSDILACSSADTTLANVAKPRALNQTCALNSAMPVVSVLRESAGLVAIAALSGCAARR